MPTVVSGSDGVSFSTWTTAGRPSSPANGQFGYNTTLGVFEGYANGAWTAVNFTLAPTNTVAPVVTGTAALNATLSVTNGTWSNSPTSYAYQWLANSVAIVANATANTFVLTSSQVGANVSCNVTAVNIAGQATATSNATGPIQSTYTATYLAVAGGGGANYGGGGGGGVLSNASTVTPGDVINVTIGAGGAVYQGNGTSTNGSNTVITSAAAGFANLNCVGGGAGGGGQNGSYTGNNGGSGGGGFYQGAGGSGTSGQGYAGGNGASSSPWFGGGGGGAGQIGFDAVYGSVAGKGGNGAISTITGSSVYYAGGGGGGNNVNGGSAQATGGLGGGGNGTSGQNGGQAGTVNTGGGGGGGSTSGAGTFLNGNGGSGVVILSVPTARFSNTYSTSNVTVTTSGSNTIMTFTSSGTYTA